MAPSAIATARLPRGHVVLSDLDDFQTSFLLSERTIFLREKDHRSWVKIFGREKLVKKIMKKIVAENLRMIFF